MNKINKSIIIPFYDCFDLVLGRLAEIQSFELPNDCEVILVNDGSVETKTLRMLESAREMFPFFRTVASEVNHGFASANNLGAAEADGRHLFFLSSDVQIHKSFWLEDLSNPDVIFGGRLMWFDTGWNTFNIPDGKRTFPYLEGWFISCSVDQFYSMGKWDTKYDPFDYEDIDLSMAAREKGYRLEGLPEEWFTHRLGGTINRKMTSGLRMQQTELNRKYFVSKWIASGRYKNIK